MIEQQIELEKQMTQGSIDNYRREVEKAKANNNYGCTSVATKLISLILDGYCNEIRSYVRGFEEGKPIKYTLAAGVINRLNDIEAVAFISSKIILNAMWIRTPIQALYKAIGQAIEDEYKMREFRDENTQYYRKIQSDLNSRGAKANRKKNITTGVFNKRLDFHVDRWTITEKFQTGLVLTNIFVKSTGIVEFEEYYKKNKLYKIVVPSEDLITWTEQMDDKLELMQPLFLPMVCQPKEWTSVLDGGYISPYLKKNRLVKNNSKGYLKKLETATMPMVYEAINHLQNTKWQVNREVLDVVEVLWDEGKAIAELPDREDEPLIPFPYPDMTEDDAYTTEQLEVVKKWKRDTYEIHKRNVTKRSIRILVSQILRIAKQFRNYETIWFPYQMDFRGRLYPIPVLLTPQGTDLSKGLLHFSEPKRVEQKDIKWLEIHGANTYGFDKESYTNRIKWIKERSSEIQSYATHPLDDRGWTEADKPFQFLAFCFEYNRYLNDPTHFYSQLPIQLDGTCNGLQHYSALLRDPVGGQAVNLINSDKPSDIYSKVAEKLTEKLKELSNEKFPNSNDRIRSDSTQSIDSNRNTCCSRMLDNRLLATQWLNLGINRKLTKRPVMVLPYGGTMLACRQYIQEYLTDNYSSNFIWKHFNVGCSPSDCEFKVSVWLSKYLWEAIINTVKAAIVGMDYLKKIARIVNHQNHNIEWITPAGLLVRQAYPSRKPKEIKTELYGSMLKTRVNIDIEDTLNGQRQVNGICPNFIHSLDAACLMKYLVKCKQHGIDAFMTIHDCYGTYACYTETSARLLREAFVEIYEQPILENFTDDVISQLDNIDDLELPEIPERGSLDIKEVLRSDYFFS